MSDISELHYCAGWIGNNEFLLWDALQAATPEARPYYAGTGPTDAELAELRFLSQQANGWIWTGTDEYHPRLVR